MAYNLEQFRAFADRRIRKTVYSSLFKRCPLLSFMVGLGGSTSNLMRPGVMGVISGAKIPAVKREEVDGAVYTDVEIVTAKSGGGKTMGARDTLPAVERSQDQNLGSARFWWWFYSQPIKVWRRTIRLSGKGKFRIQNALTKAVDMARDEAVDVLAEKFWTGQPSTYNVSANDDCYDDLPGVLEAMSASNSYGAVDRTDSDHFIDGVHPWAGNRETGSRAATLDLIDEANAVAMVYGEGIDLVLSPYNLYLRMKQEAMAKGGAIIHNGVIPGHGTVGYKRDMIKYGKTIITFDPFAPTGHVACFTMEDWVVETHPDAKFTVDEWQPPRRSGEDDALTSQIDIGLRPYCTRPRNQYLFTNVSQ